MDSRGDARMQKILLSAYSRDDAALREYFVTLGHRVRVLDCFEDYHRKLVRWYGPETLLTVEGHRSDVIGEVSRHHYDIAVVVDTEDFVRTALIVQALREAGVGHLLVVTKEAGRKTVFRRSGAHQVLVAENQEDLWFQLPRVLFHYMPA